MFEKVNPSHPDKVADRIAGALVDYAYTQTENPKIAVEVLIGHGVCHIITETSVRIPDEVVTAAVNRITKEALEIFYDEHAQDTHLADNQSGEVHCGDNGIFKGIPTTAEQKRLSELVRSLYEDYSTDGKYVLNGTQLIACQSHVEQGILRSMLEDDLRETAIINPLGYWTGGINVDTGATNRKLGSDMGDAVTGGGLHGKDLSKADVSLNIYAHLKAQETGKEVKLCCAIGDDNIDGKPYSEIVNIARNYINSIGGFEKLAEWGLV